MKIISALAAASIALVAVAAETEHVERALILGGGEVPVGTKAYVAGIRSTADGHPFCGGALITPKHVLTTSTCTYGANFVAVGAHYVNGIKDGEQIKVVSAHNHTLFNATSLSYDFAVLTLEKPSKYAPIQLPKSDNSDIIPGMWTKVMGWGDTSYPNGSRSDVLQIVGMEVWDNEDCKPIFHAVDDSSVCAGGAAGKDSCIGDTGGPLVKEEGRGDGDDVLIGLVSSGYRCGEEGYPGIYSRVSAAIEWIGSVTKAQ